MHRAAKLVLSPLLLWQGRGVRRRALRLPEAEGARVGVAGPTPSCRPSLPKAKSSVRA